MGINRLRLFITLVLLVISVAALAWSFLPGTRIVRRQKLHPTEMQLPTPSSYQPANNYCAVQNHFFEVTRAIYGADCFVLLI